MIEKNTFKKLKAVIDKNMIDLEWSYIIILINIDKSTINYNTLYYDKINRKEVEKYISIFELGFLSNEVRKIFKEKEETREKFNKVKVKINEDGDFIEKYWRDE